MKKSLLLTAIIIVFANLFPFAASANDTNITSVQSQSENFIVIFNEKIDRELVEVYGGTILQEYDSIHAATINIDTAQVEKLKQSASVKAITEENIIKLSTQYSSWGYNALQIEKKQPSTLTGKGIKIAIIDSGVDPNHPDLVIKGGTCVLDSTYDPDACGNSYIDDNGHGTHVAGIIAAQDNSIGTVGVAPGAEIYAVKALDEEGYGTTSTVMAGLEWAIDHHMDIVNLSLTTPEYDLALKLLLDKVYEKGILIVAAAGNEGTKGGTGDTVQYPGKFASVIAVGAIDQTNTRISASSTGPEVELAAPGFRIYSTVPTYPNDLGVTNYEYLSGTSMAAPFVTGMAALYLEKYPNYTNIQIRNLLQKNALDIGVSGKDNFYGYGLVQVDQTPISSDDINIPYETDSKGTITLNMAPILEKYDGYNLHRENQLLLENSTASAVTDYGTRGIISYTISPTVNGVIQKGEEIYLNINLSYPAFIDLSNNQWYSRQLVFLYSKDILRGYDGNFIKPNRYVSRAEAVSMLGRALNLSGTQRTTRFSDVPSQSFASGYIESAAKAGILTGYADGTFRPNEPVSRAEMAILISKGFSLSQSQTLSFSDVNSSIAGYQEISNLAVAGITQGYQDGTFRPQDKMNRATFAVFLARALNPDFR